MLPRANGHHWVFAEQHGNADHSQRADHNPRVPRSQDYETRLASGSSLSNQGVGMDVGRRNRNNGGRPEPGTW